MEQDKIYIKLVMVNKLNIYHYISHMLNLMGCNLLGKCLSMYCWKVCKEENIFDSLWGSYKRDMRMSMVGIVEVLMWCLDSIRKDSTDYIQEHQNQ